MWILNASVSGEERTYHLGFPPIAMKDPMLELIWEHITRLKTWSIPKDKFDVLASKKDGSTSFSS